MPQTYRASTTNRLLSRLDSGGLAAMWPRLTRVMLLSKQLIHHAGEPIDFVYFPENGMLSMVIGQTGGLQSEVGVIGRDGMAGMSLLAGVSTSFVECMVQISGTALRMSAFDFHREIDTNPAFRSLMMRYNEAFMAQLMQTAACNGRHGLEQRLARWLLLCHDRVEGDVLPLTQEFVSMMIGVHRPTITVAAGIMQRAGLIRYSGGQITIVDRARLEAASCRCYEAVRRRCDAVLPPEPIIIPAPDVEQAAL